MEYIFVAVLKFESKMFLKCYYFYGLLDVRQETIVKSHKNITIVQGSYKHL